ncbi:MAG: hypothetical protein EPN33_04040 [Acidobacteria bacterium]|nr:MAG: hypothetical protein EPN33_04040 [Acidobacteriota bacterium]
MALDHAVTRRGFLGAAGAGLAAVSLAAQPMLAGDAGEDARREHRSFEVRERAARSELRADAEPQVNNGDEALYPNFIASYSKGLPHNTLDEVDAAAYRTLLRALRMLPDTSVLSGLRLGGSEKLINPMAGVAFDLEGIDIQKLAAPPAHTLASAARAAEMIELYWMALCRDVPFCQYSSHPLALTACRALGVTSGDLFRGNLPGDVIGPYVSQLMLTPFSYGQYQLDGRLTTFPAGADYLAGPDAWLACRNGQGPFPAPQTDPVPRYFRCGRDLAAYVHSDNACEGFYNAGLRLYALHAPLNPGNPYLALRDQSPFATFGVPSTRCTQACSHPKLRRAPPGAGARGCCRRHSPRAARSTPLTRRRTAGLRAPAPRS